MMTSSHVDQNDAATPIEIDTFVDKSVTIDEQCAPDAKTEPFPPPYPPAPAAFVNHATTPSLIESCPLIRPQPFRGDTVRQLQLFSPVRPPTTFGAPRNQRHRAFAFGVDENQPPLEAAHCWVSEPNSIVAETKD